MRYLLLSLLKAAVPIVYEVLDSGEIEVTPAATVIESFINSAQYSEN